MPLKIIEKLASPTGHLKQAAAGMEVLAVSAQVLGQMIDASGKERDLDFARTGVFIVGFVFGYDFWFNDSWHMSAVGWHDGRSLLGGPLPPASLQVVWKLGRRHR
jgi:hypothetical protein